MLENYDKEVYRECSYCCCVIEIKKAFTESEFICKMCSKLFQNHDEINSKIHIIWTNNKKYRVFTNLYTSFLDKIFNSKNIRDKSGEISQETIANYLNSSIHDIKESLWVVIHLHCPIKGQYAFSVMFALWLCYKLLDIPHWATNDLKAHISLKYNLSVKNLNFYSYSLSKTLVLVSILTYRHCDGDMSGRWESSVPITDSHFQMSYNNWQ